MGLPRDPYPEWAQHATGSGNLRQVTLVSGSEQHLLRAERLTAAASDDFVRSIIGETPEGLSESLQWMNQGDLRKLANSAEKMNAPASVKNIISQELRLAHTSPARKFGGAHRPEVLGELGFSSSKARNGETTLVVEKASWEQPKAGRGPEIDAPNIMGQSTDTIVAARILKEALDQNATKIVFPGGSEDVAAVVGRLLGVSPAEEK